MSIKNHLDDPLDCIPSHLRGLTKQKLLDRLMKLEDEVYEITFWYPGMGDVTYIRIVEDTPVTGPTILDIHKQRKGAR